jgi:hypothetical protein
MPMPPAENYMLPNIINDTSMAHAELTSLQSLSVVYFYNGDEQNILIIIAAEAPVVWYMMPVRLVTWV